MWQIGKGKVIENNKVLGSRQGYKKAESPLIGHCYIFLGWEYNSTFEALLFLSYLLLLFSFPNIIFSISFLNPFFLSIIFYLFFMLKSFIITIFIQLPKVLQPLKTLSREYYFICSSFLQGNNSSNLFHSIQNAKLALTQIKCHQRYIAALC